MHVEHRSHGERILTLFKMAAEFDRQDALVQKPGPKPGIEVRRDDVHPRPGPRHSGRGPAHNRRALGSVRGDLAGSCEEVSQHSDWKR